VRLGDGGNDDHDHESSAQAWREDGQQAQRQRYMYKGFAFTDQGASAQSKGPNMARGG